MTGTTKAVLLSAVIFPGAAHFYLKKYISGVFFSVIATVCSYLIIVNFTTRILIVFEKVRAGEIAPEFLLMIQLILKQPENPEARLSLHVWIVLIVCWLVAIADSYRIARQQER